MDHIRKEFSGEIFFFKEDIQFQVGPFNYSTFLLFSKKRVPATAPEVQALKEKINQGKYDLINESTDVHTPCALLKLWLREIPEPLIPNEF